MLFRSQTQLSNNPGGLAAVAWQHALRLAQATSRRRRQFQATALVALLQRFLVAPGSTAGIEQNFSKLKRALGEQWHGSDASEERRLVLELACRGLPQETLLQDARIIWATIFGKPRKSACKLGRAGSQKLAKANGSAAAWLRRRRTQVAQCAAGDRKSTRLNSSHIPLSRMPSSA